ncbi:MAG: hypothetical protein O3B96_01515 [bacterium]|nr:hypothetical protein [bacterium]
MALSKLTVVIGRATGGVDVSGLAPAGWRIGQGESVHGHSLVMTRGIAGHVNPSEVMLRRQIMLMKYVQKRKYLLYFQCMKHDIGLIILSLITIIVIGVLMFFSGPGPEEPRINMLESASLTLADQAGDGYTAIASVSLSAGGFVSIHNMLSIAPSEPIGASIYLEPGVHENLVINLDERMELGSSYAALIRVDNGDGVLDYSDDRAGVVGEEVVREDFVFIGEPVE